MSKAPFIQEIKANPHSTEPWLVYCDWLEESEPELAKSIRSELVHRLPFNSNDFEVYRQWIERAQAGEDPIIKHQVKPSFQKDMDRVSEKKVLLNLQRDLDGRLPLKRRAVLIAYGEDPWAMGRQKCLVVVTPERRRSNPRVNIRIENLILRNHSQNWTQARWLWDATASIPGSSVTIDQILLKQAKEGIRKLEGKKELTDPERQRYCIHLLDQLRFLEAFDLYGIRWHPTLDKLLAQVPFFPDNPMVDQKHAKVFRENPAKGTKQYSDWIFAKHHHQNAIKFSRSLKTELWRAAPWKIKKTIDRVFDVRSKTLKTKRECKLRLFALPKQAGQSKLSVIVGCDKEGENHSIYLENTGVNDRLAEPGWQRDFWFDMKRVGMI